MNVLHSFESVSPPHTHNVIRYIYVTLSRSIFHPLAFISVCVCSATERGRAADTKRRSNDMRRRRAHALCIIYESEGCKRMMKTCMNKYINQMNIHHIYAVYELDMWQKCRMRETSSETSSQKIIHICRTKTTVKRQLDIWVYSTVGLGHNEGETSLMKGLTA